MYVSVVGSAGCDSKIYERALSVGREVARRGHVLVCGGLGGVMEAACRGASEEGGVSIGILPGTTRSEGNPYLTYAIPTGLGEARNALVARAGDGLIAVAGGFGTLSEVALALKWGKPVVGLDTGALGWCGASVEELVEARDPVEAVGLVEKLCGT